MENAAHHFWLKFIVAAVLVVSFGIYIGNFLFGDNSVDVLQSLNEQEAAILQEIERLKYENAKLQKEYFELKELEPKNEDSR